MDICVSSLNVTYYFVVGVSVALVLHVLDSVGKKYKSSKQNKRETTSKDTNNTNIDSLLCSLSRYGYKLVKEEYDDESSDEQFFGYRTCSDEEEDTRSENRSESSDEEETNRSKTNRSESSDEETTRSESSGEEEETTRSESSEEETSTTSSESSGEEFLANQHFSQKRKRVDCDDE